MPPLLIGIDSGTTSTKAILFDLDGNVLDTFSEGYDFVDAEPGFLEQRPDDWWRAAANGIHKLAAAAEGKGQIRALAFSTQGGTVVPVDRNYAPLDNAITWLDKRGAKQYSRLCERVPDEFFAERAGVNLGAGGVLAKMAWWRETRPGVFAAAEKFAQVNDWLMHKLTGVAASDPSNAVIAGLYNLRQGDWDGDILAMAGLTTDHVAPIVPSGRAIGNILPEVARELGLPAGVVVASGGHDQYCGALGCGVVDAGIGIVSCGTAWVLLVASDRLLLDPQQRVLPGVHTAEGRYGLLAAMSNGGIAWDKMREVVLGDQADAINRGALDAELRSIDERGAAMIFLPHLVGAASPWRRPDPRACLIGIQPQTTAAEIMFAAMQGLCLETRSALDVMRELSIDVQCLRVIGGAAKSPIWRQLLADVCQVEVRVPSNTEAACRGAAVLAGVAAGLFPTAIEGAQRMLPAETSVQPRPDRAGRYEKLHRAHRAAFDGLGDAFRLLAELREAP